MPTISQEFIDSPEFHRPDAERRIFSDPPAIPQPDISWYFASEVRKPRRSHLLTADQERTLFLQYNYARWMYVVVASSDAEASRWLRVANERKRMLVEYNLALVLAMVVRFVGKNHPEFDDLVCEGNMRLVRAVERFEVDRGYKFSTYACRGIINQVIRCLQQSERRAMNLAFESTAPDPMLALGDMVDLREVMHGAGLTDIERTVIELRFLKPDTMILEDVGKVIGVGKERTRQIQAEALEKLWLEW
ncbi:MAG: sigma-70 family RNA polymerase sigma factor [Phycisphaerales bacterium]|nr:sigma-70 family RNA polymerase sigma factor [Phycisphaerales bacterium]